MNLPLLFATPGMAILLKWTGLLALGWTAHGVLRRHHARWRLILWRGILCLGLALPLAHFFQFPGLKIPIGTQALYPAEFAGSLSAVATANTIQPAESVGQPPQTPGAASSTLRRTNSAQVSPPSKPVPWESILLLTWAFGCGCGAFRLCRLQLRLFRLRKETCRPSPDLQQLAKEIRVRLQVRREVDVQVSDAATSPFLCGVFKPAILVPRMLAQQLSQSEMAALLSHEMAHLRQHDLIWCVAWRWMKAVWWFHPLVWKVPAVHNLACEQEADRAASGQLAEPDSYSQLLARLALRVLALPALETKLTLNGSSQIARRLNHLEQKGIGAWSWRHSVAGFGLVTVLFLMTAGFDFSRAGPADMPIKQIQSAQVSPPANPNVPARAASPDESGSRLTIELWDGSRVLGKSLDDTLSFHSAALGDMELSWAAIRSIEYAGASTDTARLTATNGDAYEVQFAAPSVRMETSFGKTELPVKRIRSVKVAVVASPDGLSTVGLIGWWKLDDGSGTVAKDSSQNHQDGHLAGNTAQMFNPTLLPGIPLPMGGSDGRGAWTATELPSGPIKNGPVASLPVWTQGKNGGALQFNGASQYVSLGNILEDSYSGLSIVCWVKHPRSAWQIIVERSIWDNPDGIGLVMDHSGALVDFGHYGAQVASKASVQDGNWHHIAGTLSRQGADFIYSIYVDGKLDNTATHPEGLAASSKAWAIGARYNGSWSYQGLIEDVRIYDCALKEDEVKKLYEERD